jgi:hypothetical protein
MALSTEMRRRHIGALRVGAGAGWRTGRGVWPRGHPCGIMKDNEVLPPIPTCMAESCPGLEESQARPMRRLPRALRLVPSLLAGGGWLVVQSPVP